MTSPQDTIESLLQQSMEILVAEQHILSPASVFGKHTHTLSNPTSRLCRCISEIPGFTTGILIIAEMFATGRLTQHRVKELGGQHPRKVENDGIIAHSVSRFSINQSSHHHLAMVHPPDNPSSSAEPTGDRPDYSKFAHPSAHLNLSAYDMERRRVKIQLGAISGSAQFIIFRFVHASIWSERIILMPLDTLQTNAERDSWHVGRT
jgi:hypothetical protein